MSAWLGDSILAVDVEDAGMAGAIFVGGTGRSGSTVVGYLLGAHPAVWATMPREVRFITDRGGLLDLVYGARSRIALPPPSPGGALAFAQWLRTRLHQRSGDGIPTTIEPFLQRLHGHWWERRSPEGEPRGLHRGLDAAEVRVAIAAFTEQFDLDPDAAARQLVHALLQPPTRRAGRHIWADTTPQNAENAHRIVRLLPDAHVVFVIRDGRDTVASVMRKQWGPEDWLTGLEWWRIGALKAHRSTQRTDRALTIVLESLVRDTRTETLLRLFHGLGLDITDEVLHFFDTRVLPERAHFGRWESELPSRLRPAFSRRYEQIWRELTGDGLALPPIG